jgi:hypothetical protein
MSFPLPVLYSSFGRHIGTDISDHLKTGFAQGREARTFSVPALIWIG